MVLLVLHENEIEDTVKDGIYQVCNRQVEDEEVCNSSHSLVSCKTSIVKPWPQNLKTQKGALG